MKYLLLSLTTSMALAGVAAAQDPAPRPGTHVESTVVGDARVDDPASPVAAAGLDNEHHFEAGAPRLNEMAASLNLSPQQKAQLNDIIERGDAGAAVLIKREQNVKEMLDKTPVEDPRYAQLRAEQADAPARWQSARDAVHQQIRAILTPAQQAKYEQWQAQRSPRQ